MKSIEKIEAIGNRWQKNGMDRIYINADALGFDANNNTFNGKKISKGVANDLRNAKTYIDMNNNTICSSSPMLAAAVADIMDADYSYGLTTINF